MPDNEDSFGLEVLLSLDDVLSKVLAIVANLSVHVIHHKWLGKIEFIV